MTFPNRFKLTVGLVLLSLSFSAADVCVWRNPERTMSRIFPGATDYETVTLKISTEEAAAIEKGLGVDLDPSEKAEFNFYDLRTKKDGKVVSLGTAMALAGNGEYGSIEVVLGVDTMGRIKAVYIQRSREKGSKSLESDAFLGQFIGKSIADPLQFGHDLKSLERFEKSAEAVRFTIKKMLLFHHELQKKK